ncbi:hypothetical protein BH10PSE13_BH10PSE13_23910 [soil metagenome]
MPRGLTLSLLPLLLLSACATPEARLRTGLVDAGLPENLSRCMARDMTPYLSIAQLLRLRDLSGVGDPDTATTGIDSYLHQVRALGDREIWTVTARSAARCALSF